MKCVTTGVLSLLVAVGVLAVSAWSQPPGGPQGMQRGRGGGPARGGPQGQHSGDQPSINLLIMALNANGDSEISAAEIKKAAASLKKLDRNNDGKLTADELMPVNPQAFGGRGQGRSAGQTRGRGRQRGRFGGPGESGPGGPGESGGPRERGRGLVEQLMGLDSDKDGKVTKEELSEGAERIFEKGDLDNDGAIDQEEAEKLAQQFGPPHGGPDGGDGARGERPVRTERPQRPK